MWIKSLDGIDNKILNLLLDNGRMSYSEIGDIVGLSRTAVKNRIIELEDSFQLCSKTEYYDVLIKIAKQPKKYTLTDVQLEVLSITAYKQPITRAEIEKIRGVNSDHAINKLVEYGLIEEVGRLNAPGRPMLFGTTEDFLRNFGVTSIEELPSLSATEMADFEAEAEEEIQIRLGV